MARPKKKKLTLDSQESLQNLLQEIYNECFEQRSKAIYSYNKLMNKEDEITDIAMIGKVTSEYLKIANEAIEKKLSIARLLKDVIYKDGNNQSKQSTTSLTEEDKKMLHDLIKDESEKSGIEYDVKIDKPKKD